MTNRLELDVAILGGGFAGVYCAKTLCRKLGPVAANRVGLISDENYMVFQPMLPEVSGGTIAARHVLSPLRLLCRRAQVFKGRVEQVDTRARSLVMHAGPFTGKVEVGFQHLVLALGASVDLSNVPGMAEHGLLMRNVGDAMQLRNVVIGRVEEANLERRVEVRQRLLTFVVVGGGYSGVETAGHLLDLLRSVERYYASLSRNEVTVYLVHSRDHLLPTLSRRLGEYSARKLTDRGLKIIFNERVKAVTAERVYLGSGRLIETNTVVATIGNSPHPLVAKLCADAGIENEKGHVLTDEFCRAKGHTFIWAAGDCAAVPYVGGGFCPSTAQFAMRQGKLIGTNLRLSEQQRTLQPFRFKGFGEMASIGHLVAVADIMGMRFSGFFAWWIWRTVYLAKLPRFDRKVRVMLDWTLDLFFPRDINHLSPRFSRILQQVHLEAGDSLFHRGEPAFSLYIVKRGCVRLLDGTKESRSFLSGDYFGEAALLGDRVWAHDAQATEPTTLVAIPANVFYQIVSGAGSLARFFKRSAEKFKSKEAFELLARKMPATFLSQPISNFMHSEVHNFSNVMRMEDALSVAREHPRSSYPMIDSSGALVGVVDRQDFYDFIKRPVTHSDSLLRDLPLSNLPVFGPKALVQEVLNGMAYEGGNKAVIVDELRKPVGIITVLDLLAASCAEDVTPTTAG